MTLPMPEGNPYRPPGETPQNAESSPLQLPIRGVVWVDESLLRKAIRYWIRRKGYVRQQQVRLGILAITAGLVFGAWIDRWQAAGPRFAWPYVAFSGLGVLALMALVAWVPRSLAGRIFRGLAPYKTPGTFGAHRLEITDQIFRRTNEHSELAWRLESMSGVARYPDLLLVEITPNSFMAIPATADFGINTFEAVANYLESRVGRPPVGERRVP